MSASQRSKGARGEREVARLISDLLCFEVSRRCRQHDGDCDLEGVPGWSVEVKNHSKVTRSILMGWWQQADAQAGKLKPCLWYKRAPGWWRVIWAADRGWTEWASLHEGEPEAWAAAVRETLLP
jgi:hypothetical protein